MRGTILILVGLLAGIALPGSALANHVDFFQDGTFEVQLVPGNISATNTHTGDPGNILGGERFVMLEYASGGDGGAAQATKFDGLPGLFFDNGADASSILTLEYGRTSPLNSDFDTQWDLIRVTFSFVEGTGALSLAVEGGGNTGTSLSVPVSAPGTFDFSFTDPAFSGVNFQDVDRVVLRLEAQTKAADFRLASITREVIPEPGPLVLLGSGLAALALLRRRR